MPQWPLSQEKLLAARQLVQEQLLLDHIEPSVSPWNTPIFVIKRKSGKWRLLHDLRAVNAQMQIMGAIQRGLPLLTALPKAWPMYAVDIKDCFFSIPLHVKDRERFAFTIPSVNHEEPDKRFQWKVLPQGMANSPTMCQLYMDNVLQPVRRSHPTVRFIHYMDDILITASSETVLNKAFISLTKALESKGLLISSDKVQQSTIIQFLGAIIHPFQVKPQKMCIRTSHLKTLNDFQQLLGNINWLRGYLSLPRSDLQPLFFILEGNPDVNSSRDLTPMGKVALEKVELAIEKASLCRFDPEKPLQLCILKTKTIPTGVLWQEGPLWWLHGHSLGVKTIQHYPTLVASQALLGVKFSLTHFGNQPNTLVVPYTRTQVEILAGTTDEWAILLCTFHGVIDNHYPKDDLLSFVNKDLVYFPKVTSKSPLTAAITIYTDGSKTGLGAYAIQGQEPVILTFRPEAPQVVECQVVLEVFKKFKEPFNLFSDSLYVVNAVSHLEVAANIHHASMVAPILDQIQTCILNRREPFYIGHIRAHSLLPGPMSYMNDRVDKATRPLACPALDPLQAARDFHRLYHVPATTLRLKFKLPRHVARDIVKGCASCVPFHHPPHVGVNPKGLKPLSLWQMDVTHVSEFGKLRYLHVSVDTFSGIIYATPSTGEKVSQVKAHCLEAWAAWGKPQKIKTDNGPAYTSRSFGEFCTKMGISHTLGLPYNPQGQGIVERANRTLKELLQKQKGGIAEHATPKERISLALFTLNFLVLNDFNQTAADRHAQLTKYPQEAVMWKDVLDNKWYGPDPVIQRSRGAVCVFPQERADPIWVPERLTRKIKGEEEEKGGDEGRKEDAVLTEQHGSCSDPGPDPNPDNPCL